MLTDNMTKLIKSYTVEQAGIRPTPTIADMYTDSEIGFHKVNGSYSYNYAGRNYAAMLSPLIVPAMPNIDSASMLAGNTYDQQNAGFVMLFGEGSTLPTANDYTLEKPLFSNSLYYTQCKALSDYKRVPSGFNKDAVIYKAELLAKNVSGRTLTLRELGLFNTVHPYLNSVLVLTQRMLIQEIVLQPREYMKFQFSVMY